MIRKSNLNYYAYVIYNFGTPELLTEPEVIRIAKQNGRKNTRRTRSIGDKTVTEYLIDKREAEARMAQERLVIK